MEAGDGEARIPLLSMRCRLLGIIAAIVPQRLHLPCWLRLGSERPHEHGEGEGHEERDDAVRYGRLRRSWTSGGILRVMS